MGYNRLSVWGSRTFMAKRALITGITGQDGSYLAEFLLSKGYEVFGMVRRLSAPNAWRIQHIVDRLHLRQADLLDQLSLIQIVETVQPARDLQPRGDVVRAHVVGPADADRRVQCAGRDPRARGHPRASTPASASTRPRPARCSARSARCRRPSRRPSIRAAPTASRRSSATTSPSTTGRATACLPAPASSSTTNRPRRGLEFVTRKVSDGVARIKLGLAKELRHGQSRRASATGVSPATTCGRCG